jgi:hypothetical protein
MPGYMNPDKFFVKLKEKINDYAGNKRFSLAFKNYHNMEM